jgi:hypothetical protein
MNYVLFLFKKKNFRWFTDTKAYLIREMQYELKGKTRWRKKTKDVMMPTTIISAVFESTIRFRAFWPINVTTVISYIILFIRMKRN